MLDFRHINRDKPRASGTIGFGFFSFEETVEICHGKLYPEVLSELGATESTLIALGKNR